MLIKPPSVECYPSVTAGIHRWHHQNRQYPFSTNYGAIVTVTEVTVPPDNTVFHYTLLFLAADASFVTSVEQLTVIHPYDQTLLPACSTMRLIGQKLGLVGYKVALSQG
jgi:hypothetical protein